MSECIVIIAEDDDDDLFIFTEIIKEMGDRHTIVHARHCNDLIRLIDDYHSFHCIFLDINLPGITGVDCIARLRQHPHVNQKPIVMLSGLKHKEAIDDAHSKGANYFISKGGDFGEMKTKIGKFFQLDNEALVKQVPRDLFEITPN